MNLHVKEDGTSPVIGTILLVAIAVILVAVILTVVMGFSGDANEKKIGLNAKAAASGTNATLILYGGESIDELVSLKMIDQDSPNGSYVEFWNINENGTALVGHPYSVKDVAQPVENMDIYDTRINVLGTFRDGTEKVLLVQPMTFTNAYVSSDDGSEHLAGGFYFIMEEGSEYNGWHIYEIRSYGGAVVDDTTGELLIDSFTITVLKDGVVSSSESVKLDYIANTVMNNMRYLDGPLIDSSDGFVIIGYNSPYSFEGYLLRSGGHQCTITIDVQIQGKTTTYTYPLIDGAEYIYYYY